MKKAVAQQNNLNHQTILYRCVFSSNEAKIMAWVLLVFLLLQPVAPVWAAETAEETEDVIEEIVEEDVIEEVAEEEETDEAEEISLEPVEDTEDNTEADPETDSNAADEESEEAEESEEEVNEQADTDADEPEIGNEEATTDETASTTDADTTDNATATTTEDGTDAEDTATTTDTSTGTSTSETGSGGGGSSGGGEDEAEDNGGEDAADGGDSGETATTTDTSADDENETTATTTATSTESIASTTDETVEAHVVDNGTALNFNAADCVAVADGSYYCAETNASEPETEDALFAKADSDGDMEIYLQKDSVLHKITDNIVDDRAPYYDPVSETIVWHRMVNDRYHIISFDIEKGIESILTTNNTNNMEPTRIGDITVWQRWVQNNWEIMLYDGTEIVQLTDNEVHDVAPRIRDGHILWQSVRDGDEKQVTVYEIATGRMNTIDDVDGGVIDNPRLVLVYETTFENGDVVTRGFDFETGKIIPLSATPAEVPDEIPDSDSTGETRALIQQKTQTRSEVVNRPTEPDGTNQATTTATSTVITKEEATLDISTTTPSITESGTREIATSTEHISDVVIPPHSSSTPAETG